MKVIPGAKFFAEAEENPENRRLNFFFFKEGLVLSHPKLFSSEDL